VAARWRGAELDRLLDEQHSWLQAAWKARLEGWGWDVAVETSFNRYGERGRIDLLAWRAALRILLVIEVKTEVVDAQGLLGGLDVKTRLSPFVGRQLGWARPALVAPALIITQGSTNRDRISRLAPLFGRFQLRGRAAISWLRRPEGVVTGLLLFSDLRPATTSRVTRLGRQRIRCAGSEASVARARDNGITRRPAT